jgi:hypothetical protein
MTMCHLAPRKPANARLSATDGIAAMAVQAPVSPVGLTRLWLPILKTLRELEAGDARSRSVPVWLWTEDHEDGPVAWFSFDVVSGGLPSLGKRR